MQRLQFVVPILAVLLACVLVAPAQAEPKLRHIVVPMNAESSQILMLQRLVFSPDGKTLAAYIWIRGVGNIRLVDVATGKVVRSVGGGTAFEFSPDGKTLLAVADKFQERKEIVRWLVATGKELRTYPVRSQARFSHITFGTDGKTLAAIDSLGSRILRWDARSRYTTGVKWISPPEDLSFKAAAFSPHLKTLAVQNNTDHLELWDTVTGKKLATSKEQVALISDILFSPDGKTLATDERDDTLVTGSIRLWDVATLKTRTTLMGKVNLFLPSLSFSRDGKALALGTYAGMPINLAIALGALGNKASFPNGYVTLLDVASGKITALLKRPGQNEAKGSVAAVSFSPDGRILAAGLSDGSIELWDLNRDGKD